MNSLFPRNGRSEPLFLKQGSAKNSSFSRSVRSEFLILTEHPQFAPYSQGAFAMKAFFPKARPQ